MSYLCTMIKILYSEEFWEKLELTLKKLELRKEKTPQWLRSADVRKMLNISDSTLQTMRVNRSIPATKLGSTWFYKYEEIIAELEAGKMKGGTDAK